jgi:tetrahedral aminopeptidase
MSRAGVATAILGLPCRYMHTQIEVVSRKDLASAAKVLAETITMLTPNMSLIPK